MDFNFIEVCAGGGGLSLGLELAGFKPLLLNDINPDCCKTLALNKTDCSIKCGSMDTLDALLEKLSGHVDLLAGGVPCQSFSQAGLRKGLDDSRGELMFKYVDLIVKLNPKMFLIENVKGLLTHEKGETLNSIIMLIMLKTCNKYNIDYQVLNSVNFNVPQKRERIFIIGYLQNMSFQIS